MASFAAYRLVQAEHRRGGRKNNRFWERAQPKVNALRAASGQPPLTADEWEDVEAAIAEAREAKRPWLAAALAAFPQAAATAAAVVLALLLVGRPGPLAPGGSSVS